MNTNNSQDYDNEDYDIEDYDIDDYDIEELTKIFDLSTPLNTQEIISKLDTLEKKFIKQNNSEFANFIAQARYKLIKNINPQDFLNVDENTDAADVLSNQYWNNNDSDKNIPDRKNMTKTVAQQSQNILQQERLNVGQNKNIEFVQGQLNPDMKNTFTRLLNIDSQFREIVNTNQDLCPPTGTTGAVEWKGQVNKNSIKLDSPTNFTFDLSEPLTNVEEIQLNDVQIPRAWYVFDSAYGTNSFTYNGEKYTIPSGNYNGTELADAVSNAETESGVVFAPTVTYNANTNKITISDKNIGDEIDFYQENVAKECGKKGSGSKINYNLGWLMGFREKSYTGSTEHTGEALVDTFGPKYLFIVLDDFNKNRISYNLVGMTNNRDTFKLPSYYNKNTMKIDCSNNNVVEAKTRPCRKGTPSTKEFLPVDNLTQAQQYTANSIIQAQNSKTSDKHFSPNNANILAKIPIESAINPIGRGSAPLFGNLSIPHTLIENNKRTYFGPVTLKRLNVQLINDKGYEVNMNHMDWSMSLKVKQLYQY